MKCDRCNKKIDLNEKTYTDFEGNKELIVCLKCYNEIKEEMKGGRDNTIKKIVNKSKLTIPELQLQELMEMKAEIGKMKGDLHTISKIILFWFIIGLIGFIISILSFLVLSGS